jgi:uncharacterized protein YecT (DUF1311 family)
MFGPVRLALAVTSLIAPGLASADDRLLEKCGDLATGAEQKHCAEQRYREAADALQAAYGRALARAANADDKAAATASQRAWEAYRDAECRGVVGRGGGSGRMVWVLGCLKEKTDARTGELDVPYEAR